MILRTTLAALALAAPMMLGSTASQAGGLHHLSSLCPLNLLMHHRGTEKAAPAKVAKKAAPAKVAKAAPKK